MSASMIGDDADRLLSIKEVATRLRTGQAFVTELINAGLLPVLKFKRDRRIPKSAFNRFITEYTGKDLYEVLQDAKSVSA